MGINEDAVSDLEDKGIILPEDAPISDSLVTTEVMNSYDDNNTGDMSSMVKEDGNNQDAILNLINSADVSIDMIQKEVKEVQELTEISENINSQNYITKDDALIVDKAFNNCLLTDGVSIEQFTNTPTRVNLDTTKKRMKKFIASKEESITNNLSDLYGRILTDISLKLSEVNDKYLHEVTNGLVSVRQRYSLLLNSLQDNPNLVVQVDDTFINIANTPLNDLQLDKTNLDIPLKKEAIKSLLAIKELIKDPILNKFLNVSSNKDSLLELLNKEDLFNFNESVITGRELLKVLVDVNTENLIHELYNFNIELMNNIAAIDDVPEEDNKIEKLSGVIQLVDNSSVVLKLILQLRILVSVSDDLFTFYGLFKIN